MQEYLDYQSEILEKLHESGFNVIPIGLDGNRVPLVKWARYQDELFPFETRWFPCGLAIVCGITSNNLEVIDFDDINCFPFWSDRIRHFHKYCVVKTPSNGRHVYYRCLDYGRKEDLALDKDGKPRIELKAQGSLITCPYNPLEVHASKRPYQVIQGSLFDLPVITKEEREVLLSAARRWNLKTKPVKKISGKCSHSTVPLTWEEILDGWSFAFSRYVGGHEVGYWRKDLSRDSHHATTNYGGTDRFYCFSSSAPPFESNRPYTRLECYALLHFGGDDREAAKHIAKLKYGDKDWIADLL